MIFFTLPSIHNEIYKNIEYQSIYKLEYSGANYSNSLSRYLSEIKEKISSCNKDWDIYKKYTNPYEYIHGIIPQKKRSISKLKPLSRSFYKMIELTNTFKLIPQTCIPIKTFHLAEGPGGFIEAVVNLRKNTSDTYYGMTLLDTGGTNDNIPAWKKSQYFMKSHHNVNIVSGMDGTGNLLSIYNYEYCRTNFGSSMDLVTADGGFDFSGDFNNQELMINKLLFAQMCFAISMQKQGGCFVLKIFDSFHTCTLDILYILSSLYGAVHITKPLTSRIGNSEKYIVCKNFLPENDNLIYPFLKNTFYNAMHLHADVSRRYLKCDIPLYFSSKIEEYNLIFGQQQIDNIHYTLSLIEKKTKLDKLDNLVKTNINKCIQWCTHYNVPYDQINNINIFSGKELQIDAIDMNKSNVFLQNSVPSSFYEGTDGEDNKPPVYDHLVSHS